VTSLYVDTSALGRVLHLQPEKPEIERVLVQFPGRVSSRLLGVELRRLALRDQLETRAEELLEDIAFVPLDDAVLAAAERMEPRRVATLDAIHLATAVRLAGDREIDAILTYDLRLAEGARHHGIAVLSPT
jgi:predicted nucleic acid-binding protein